MPDQFCECDDLSAFDAEKRVCKACGNSRSVLHEFTTMMLLDPGALTKKLQQELEDMGGLI